MLYYIFPVQTLMLFMMMAHQSLPNFLQARMKARLLIREEVQLENQWVWGSFYIHKISMNCFLPWIWLKHFSTIPVNMLQTWALLSPSSSAYSGWFDVSTVEFYKFLGYQMYMWIIHMSCVKKISVDFNFVEKRGCHVFLKIIFILDTSF